MARVFFGHFNQRMARLLAPTIRVIHPDCQNAFIVKNFVSFADQELHGFTRDDTDNPGSISEQLQGAGV